MRKIIAATAASALCLMSIAPAYAQANHSPAFDAPKGAAATLNLRVPLGAEGSKAKPTYGMSLTFGRTMASDGFDGKTFTRATTLADLRFDGDGLNRAKVANFDLANLDKNKQQLNLTGGGNTLLWVALAAGAGVAAYFLLIEDNDDDELDE